MDGKMPLAAIFPNIFLIDRHSHQVRHDFRKPVVVVSLDPDDLDTVAWIGEFSDVPQELPVLLGKATKIQVGKDIAQQNQPFEMDRLQESQSSARLADVGTQVQVKWTDCRKARAAPAWLTSEPRCRSEMITVSKQFPCMHHICSN
jgi:hypothetical protein